MNATEAGDSGVPQPSSAIDNNISAEDLNPSRGDISPHIESVDRIANNVDQGDSGVPEGEVIDHNCSPLYFFIISLYRFNPVHLHLFQLDYL